MEADRDRHRFDAQVVDPRRHFQHPVAKAVRHLDGVRKRKLLHPQRMLEEFQPAFHPGRLPIGACFDDIPLAGRCQKSVNGIRPANVSERHVERVSLAVCVKRLLIQPVGPRREKRDANRAGASLVICGRFEREAKDIVPLHFHFDGEIPESWNNRDGRLVSAVIQLNEGADLTRGIERGPAGLTQGCRLNARCDDREEQRRSKYAW